jgi:Lar family restriction alleviation protein
MSELKNCPFCGGEADIEEIPRSPFANEPYAWGVGCKACNIGWYEEAKEEAIAAWNRRPDRWIPVLERLPEYGDTVLTYIKHNYNDTDGWRAYRVYEYTDHWVTMGNLCEVIAWMPLPEAPKECK